MPEQDIDTDSPTRDQEAQQLLVRFKDKTSVLYLPRDSSVQCSSTSSRLHLLATWSIKTGWPIQYLKISSWDLPFVTIVCNSSIRGGKGGFGTLLKGQSRQAGAKLTTDFGACRDLQGRRLRHVNDEIKLRKWREMQRREQAGEKVPDDELWKTPSGIYNWHLMTPTWADISKKATHRIKRQFQQLDKQAQKEALKKKELENVYQNSMTYYLEQATNATESINKSIPDAIQQGLKAAASSSKKRQRPIEPPIPVNNVEPNSLVTLSGDVVVEDSSPTQTGMEIQSKSDFATAVLFLDRAAADQKSTLYYEVTLVTAGLAQIGWATLVGVTPFAPNNDIGDGVGDDEGSFALDGSRQLKFHAGKEMPYPLSWNKGDRLGCYLNVKEGTIGFSLNGEEYGIAFELDEALNLVPAFSCNEGEILQLHTTRSDCKYFPENDDVVAVGELVIAPAIGSAVVTDKPEVPTAEHAPFKTVKPSLPLPAENVKQTPPPPSTKVILPEPLDLTPYHSAQELEELGLDRLKGALMAAQVKCGGTLAERAERLFSLKGLTRENYPLRLRAKDFQIRP